MALKKTQVADKVMNPLIAGMVATLVVGFIKGTPLVNSPWLLWLQDSTVVQAMTVILGLMVGYQTRETQIGKE